MLKGNVLQFALGAIFILRKGKGVGGIAKYLIFLTGVGGWFWIILTLEKKRRVA